MVASNPDRLGSGSTNQSAFCVESPFHVMGEIGSCNPYLGDYKPSIFRMATY